MAVLKPEPNEFKGDFVQRFVSNPSMQREHTNSYTLRLAAENAWAKRDGAPTVRSKWEQEKRRLQLRRDAAAHVSH